MCLFVQAKNIECVCGGTLMRFFRNERLNNESAQKHTRKMAYTKIHVEEITNI